MATLEEVQKLAQTVPDADLLALRTWITITEMPRREAQAKVDQAQAQLIAELQDAGTIAKPSAVTVEEATEQPDAVPAWVNPTTDHARMYLAGAVVAHNDCVWESRHPGLNGWEPGATGVDERIWADITSMVVPKPAPDENTAATVISFAPGLPVQEGDVVEHEGRRYRVCSSHTTAAEWAPNEAHSLFEPL